MRDEVLLAYEMNGAPLLPQHGFPLRLVVPGWYGMTSVKWLDSITVSSEPFTGYQQSRSYRIRVEPDDPGEPVSRDDPALAHDPAGSAGLRDARAARGARALHGPRPRLVGPRRHLRGRGQRGRRSVVEPCRLGPSPSRYAWRSWSGTGTSPRPATTSSAAGPPTMPATPSRSTRPGTSADTRTTPCIESRSTPLEVPCGASPPGDRALLAQLVEHFHGKGSASTRPAREAVGFRRVCSAFTATADLAE